MPQATTVTVATERDAEELRKKLRQWARARGARVAAERLRDSAPSQAPAYYREHNTNEVQYGQKFAEYPEGVVMQSGTGTMFVSEKSGRLFSGFSKEQVLELSFYFWFSNLSKAQQERIRRLLEEKGEELPYGL